MDARDCDAGSTRNRKLGAGVSTKRQFQRQMCREMLASTRNAFRAGRRRHAVLAKFHAGVTPW
jgi:hypothetical protein